MIHTVKAFSIVNEAEVDVILEFSYFFYDLIEAGNFSTIGATSWFLFVFLFH